MIHPSGCGVLGVLRKRNAPKIKGEAVVRAIQRVKYRGSDRGAGFAVFDLDSSNKYFIKAFYEGDPQTLERVLEGHGIKVDSKEVEFVSEDICDCKFEITLDDLTKLKKSFRNINEILWKGKSRRGRLYSFGSSLRVYKGVGYPLDVARIYKVEEMEGLRDKEYIEIMDKLEGKAKEYAKRLFEEKVGIPTYEYRELTDEEFKELSPIIRDYSEEMGSDYTELLKEKFTVIKARKK
ncbi:MAG: hypothetical protein L7G92_03185 [Stygiolobus sp.]|nr:hypothetical protein [Stygiolobus sp.]